MARILLYALAFAVMAYVANLLLQPKFNPNDFAGKRVVVTGASMGIGEQMAYEVAKMKGSVVLVARSKDKMERIVKKCKELGATGAYYISADLSTKDESELKRIIDDSVKLLNGGMDMLILNHLSPSEVILQPSWPDALAKNGLPWLVDQYHLNVFSYMVLSNYALPILEKSNGKIGVVSSMSGVMGISKTVAYSSMKHALHGYFNSLRLNLKTNKRYNTTITICVLGAIDTDALKKSVGDNVKNVVTPAPADECARQIIENTYLGTRTMYYPENVVRPSAYMAALFPSVLDFVMGIALGEG